MRKIIGREESRAKYSAPSFFPTISVEAFPFSSVAVKLTAGLASPYLARLSGVSLEIADIFAEEIDERRLLTLPSSASAPLGLVNSQPFFSFFASSSPDEFLRLNDATCPLTI